MGDYFDKFKNDNGTFNGAEMLADFSGLSTEEVQWTFKRMKELISEGKTPQEAIPIVFEEGKSKPWL